MLAVVAFEMIPTGALVPYGVATLIIATLCGAIVRLVGRCQEQLEDHLTAPRPEELNCTKDYLEAKYG